jgi:RNA recognition motif-containing protein
MFTEVFTKIGYGFVKMANYAAAYSAIQALNGTKVENKYLQVSFKT